MRRTLSAAGRGQPSFRLLACLLLREPYRGGGGSLQARGTGLIGQERPTPRAPHPCGLAGGPGRGAQGDVDAAGGLGVAGVAPLGGRQPGNNQDAREAPLAKEEAEGGAGGRAQAGPDEGLGPLADAQVAGGGGGRGLGVQGRRRGAQGQPAAREPPRQLVDRRGRLQEGRAAVHDGAGRARDGRRLA